MSDYDDDTDGIAVDFGEELYEVRTTAWQAAGWLMVLLLLICSPAIVRVVSSWAF